jgi:S1-C subfamily serine protease
MDDDDTFIPVNGLPPYEADVPYDASEEPEPPFLRDGQRRRRQARRRLVAGASAAALVIGGAAVGGAVVGLRSAGTSGSAAATAPTVRRDLGAGEQDPYGGGDLDVTPQVPQGYPGQGDGTIGGSGATTTTTAATSSQEVGVVDIDVVLGYQGAKAAATGIVLTSTGEVLTNNHVVDGATSFAVTVVSTGRTYSASVVGYDVSRDLAVLQLHGASGLSVAKFSTGGTPAVGAPVVGVGNAGGTGGTPSAAAGTVVAVNQSITATDENGSNAEQLTGLIETDAAIAAGDSGGPLYDASGAVVGVDTAASAGGQAQGYAIPIATALQIAAQIEAGDASATVHVGATAMLGVEVSGRSSALVEGVVAGGAAARAGVVAGDTITALAGHTVSTPASLSNIVSGLAPGHPVVIRWRDQSGVSHHATVTLTSGPAF